MASQLQQMSDSVPQRRRLHLKEITNEGGTSDNTIGGLLRATRQKLGEDLKSAARVTKIRAEYLEALEEGKIDKLPGRTYAIGFLKTYADFLGLDPAECVAKFKTEHAPPPPAEGELEIGIKEPEPEMRVPQGTLVIVGVVIILLVYAGVYLFRSANTYMDERAKQQSAPLAAAPAEPAAKSAAEPAPPSPAAETNDARQPAGALPLPGTQSGLTPSNPGSADQGDIVPPSEDEGAASADAKKAPAATDKPKTPAAAAPAPAPPAASAAAAPAAAPSAPAGPSYEEAVEKAGHSFGAADGPGRIVLRATQNVFVRITTSGARQEIIHQGVLAKGDVFYVPAKDNLVLVTRNGGAVEVFLDKTYKGTLGPKGVALSNFALTPKSFER